MYMNYSDKRTAEETAGAPSKAKIANTSSAIVADENVWCFQVTVHDPALVYVSKSTQQLSNYAFDFSEGQRLAQVVKIRAQVMFHEFHHHVHLVQQHTLECDHE